MISLILLLLSLSIYTYTEGIANCGADKRFRVTKNSNNYLLQLCTSMNHCTAERNFISRKGKTPCNFCQRILRRTESECNTTEKCEAQIDSFLSDYCVNATFEQIECATSSPLTEEPITPTACTNVSRVYITKVIQETVKVSITHSTHEIRTQAANISEINTQAPTVSLGILTGLFLAILAVAITGWVWTCWILRNKTQFHTKCQDCEEKKSYPNPIYGITTEKSAAGPATQLHSQKESNGQIHNALNRGHSDTMNTGNFHGNKNHNQLEVQMNGLTGEGESGEEHMYHVLGKSGDDDYEDPDKDLEENMAMQYEIPVPLKET